LLKLGVIEESKATEWSQVHLVPKPNPNEWRFTLDFVRLNACTGGLEGWPIPNILKVLERIGTLKPKMFGLIDFTAGYHQTPLHEKSRDLSAFITADGLYQWTRVAMGLKGAGPYFQCSMASKVLAGPIYRIYELYIDDVLILWRSLVLWEPRKPQLRAFLPVHDIDTLARPAATLCSLRLPPR
jgi:hypothetical protein